MFSPQTAMILIFMATGMLFILLGIPLLRGQVARNGIYGFRTPKTLSSDRVWYPANRYCGIEMIRAGCMLFVASGVLLVAHLVAGVSVETVANAGLVFTIVPLTIAVVRSFKYLKTL